MLEFIIPFKEVTKTAQEAAKRMAGARKSHSAT